MAMQTDRPKATKNRFPERTGPDWTGPVGLEPRDYGDGPVPPKDLIRRAVERARGWSHGRR